MCLVIVAHRVSPEFPLVIAANRDEDHDRPTLPAHWWDGEILGGRDALAGGTWLAMTRTGRFAAVTNLRAAPRAGAPSRGELVAQFLRGDAAPLAYANDVAARAAQFAGFHLIAGQAGGEIGYVTNAPGAEGAHRYADGVHGVSNGPPQERWPKVVAGEAAMQDALASGGDADAITAELLRFLRSTRGGTPDREPFVLNERWGTRSSTVIVAAAEEIRFVEQSWTRRGEPDGDARRFLWSAAA